MKSSITVLQERAARYLTGLRAGNFESLYSDASGDFRAQLTPDALRKGWEQVTALAGAFEQTLHTQAQEDGERTTIIITEHHANQDLSCSFIFEADGSVSGFLLSFVPSSTPYELEATDEYEELATRVGDGERKLDGVLTLPKGTRKPPIVVMVQGSGQSDRDEAIGPNRPFADLAHGLAARGVATLRYNKRYYQYPAESEITVEMEITDDASAVIRLAASDQRVDGSRLYLLGHSLGGMLAPKLARDNPQVRGIISLAGSPRRLTEIMHDQNRAMLAQDASLTDEQRSQKLNELESVIRSQPAAYWRSLEAIDTPAIARQLAIPMLMLQGENDFQVTAAVDYRLWQEALAGKDSVTFRLYPGLSHLFMPAPDASFDMSVYHKPAHVVPGVIGDIADWIWEK